MAEHLSKYQDDYLQTVKLIGNCIAVGPQQGIQEEQQKRLPALNTTRFAVSRDLPLKLPLPDKLGEVVAPCNHELDRLTAMTTLSSSFGK